MTKRRTIEIIVETEELLVVNRRSGSTSLKCPECGALVESQAHVGTVASHNTPYDVSLELPGSDSSPFEREEGIAAPKNPQLDDFDQINRCMK